MKGTAILVKELEERLDSFDVNQRSCALAQLLDKARAGQVDLPDTGQDVNLHCHTFFSYNSYGYSPSKFAWLARRAGLAVAGIADFDVLDGLQEFLEASKSLNLKACAGIETRVFVPELADKEINSLGEPGIAYHTGVGFPTANLKGWLKNFLDKLKDTAQQRNRELMQRVNKYLSPVELDYQRDVLVLTPSGNPTERHLCLAYARKAQGFFPDRRQLTRFWADKLGVEPETSNLPEGWELLNTIRAKTMKSGCVGYIRPDAGSFPKMQRFNEFVLSAGAIPALAWLNGLSEGEREINKLLEVSISGGTTALTIIPDRNYSPGVKDEKLENLYQILELAEKLDWPVFVGTEMNSPGQKFVDAFQSMELKPFVPVFLKGAFIAYAHSVLQKITGLGYCSNWAKENFKSVKEKNSFYKKTGSLLEPKREDCLQNLSEDFTPQQILEGIKA